MKTEIPFSFSGETTFMKGDFRLSKFEYWQRKKQVWYDVGE